MAEEQSEEIQELLRYRESTAGGIMTREFVAVHEDMTVEQAPTLIPVVLKSLRMDPRWPRACWSRR